MIKGRAENPAAFEPTPYDLAEYNAKCAACGCEIDDEKDAHTYPFWVPEECYGDVICSECFDTMLKEAIARRKRREELYGF